MALCQWAPVSAQRVADILLGVISNIWDLDEDGGDDLGSFDYDEDDARGFLRNLFTQNHLNSIKLLSLNKESFDKLLNSDPEHPFDSEVLFQSLKDSIPSMNWKHLLTAAEHENASIAALIRSVLKKQTIAIGDLMEISSRSQLIEPLKRDHEWTTADIEYFENLIKRIADDKWIKSEDEMKLRDDDAVALDPSLPKVTMNLLRDIYGTHKTFMFGAQNFEKYEPEHFKRDIVDKMERGIVSKQFYSQFVEKDPVICHLSLYPNWLIRDNLFQVFAVQFAVSHLVKSLELKQIGNGLSIHCVVIPQSVVSLYDHDVEFDRSISDEHKMEGERYIPLDNDTVDVEDIVERTRSEFLSFLEQTPSRVILVFDRRGSAQSLKITGGKQMPSMTKMFTKFRRNHVIEIEYEIKANQSGDGKSVTAHFHFGDNQCIRFCPQQLVWFIPRLFVGYTALESLPNDYRSGFRAECVDSTFNRYYEMITGWKHESGNSVNRTETVVSNYLDYQKLALMCCSEAIPDLTSFTNQDIHEEAQFGDDANANVLMDHRDHIQSMLLVNQVDSFKILTMNQESFIRMMNMDPLHQIDAKTLSILLTHLKAKIPPMTWSHISTAMLHENISFGKLMESILSTQSIRSFGDAQSHKMMIEAMRRKRILYPVEITYINDMMKRATTREWDPVRSQTETNSKFGHPEVTMNLLRDIYGTHKVFLFGSFQFQLYEMKQFQNDIGACPSMKSIDAETVVNDPCIRSLSLYPTWLIRDDLFQVFAVQFAVSHLVNSLGSKQIGDGLSIHCIVIPQSVVSLYDHDIKYQYSLNINYSEPITMDRHTVDVNSIIEQIRNLFEAMQESRDLIIVVDRREKKQIIYIVDNAQMAGMDVFRSNHFISMEYRVERGNDDETKSIKTWLHFGFYQSLRFWPEQLMWFIPRLFLRNNMSEREYLKRIYGNDYRHGFRPQLHDLQFNRWYKILTGYDHESVNYYRLESMRQRCRMQDYFEGQLTANPLMNRVMCFVESNEYDSDAIFADIASAEGALTDDVHDSNIVDHVQSQSGNAEHQMQIFHHFHDITRKSQTLCSMNNVLEIWDCQYIKEIIQHLRKFQEEDCNFDITILSKLDCAAVVRGLDHLVTVHDLFSSECKSKIRAFAQLHVRCDLNEDCTALFHQCWRRREIPGTQRREDVRAQVKAAMIEDLFSSLTLDVLCSAHCYLLHSEDRFYRQSGQSLKFEVTAFGFMCDDDENKDEDGVDADDAPMSLDWGKHVLQWLPAGVKPIFDSFWEELLENTAMSVDRQTLDKLRMQCETKVTHEKCHGIIFDIYEMLCLKLYSDFTQLQRKFRRVHWKSIMMDVKRKFYHWALTMYKTFLFHAVPIPPPRFSTSQLPQPLYHGLSKMFSVETATPAFMGPLSTTTSKKVAQRFHKQIGLEFEIQSSYVNPVRLIVGINMKGISCFPEEEEILLHAQMLSIVKTTMYEKNEEKRFKLLLDTLKITKVRIASKKSFYGKSGVRFRKEWTRKFQKHRSLLLAKSVYLGRIVAYRMYDELHISSVTHFLVQHLLENVQQSENIIDVESFCGDIGVQFHVEWKEFVSVNPLLLAKSRRGNLDCLVFHRMRDEFGLDIDLKRIEHADYQSIATLCKYEMMKEDVEEDDVLKLAKHVQSAVFKNQIDSFKLLSISEMMWNRLINIESSSPVTASILSRVFRKLKCGLPSITWKHFATALKHENLSLGRMLKSILSERQNIGNFDDESARLTVLECIHNKRSLLLEIDYVRNLMDRTVDRDWGFDDVVKDELSEEVDFDHVWPDLTPNLVRDIYGTHKIFMFGSFKFHDYTLSDFKRDVERAEKGDEGVAAVFGKVICSDFVATDHKIKGLSLYPTWLIRDDLFQVFAVQFAVSHLVNSLKTKRIGDGLSINCVVIPHSVVSLYDHDVKHPYSFGEIETQCIFIAKDTVDVAHIIEEFRPIFDSIGTTCHRKENGNDDSIIGKIDQLLHRYYLDHGRDDYLDENGNGKFALFCDDVGIDEEVLEEELSNLDPSESLLVDLDENFPFKDTPTDFGFAVLELLKTFRDQITCKKANEVFIVVDRRAVVQRIYVVGGHRKDIDYGSLRKNHFIFMEYQIHSTSSIVKTWLHFGNEQCIRFWPEQLVWFIPRLFLRENGNNYDYLMRIYGNDYRHGFRCNLDDPIFNRYYKILTGYNHESVNYYRSETLFERFGFTDFMENQSIGPGNALFSKILLFLVSNEYDSDSICADTAEALRGDENDSNILLQCRSENAKGMSSVRVISALYDFTKKTQEFCTINNVLELWDCHFVKAVIKNLQLFRDKKFQIDESNVSAFDHHAITRGLDHLVTVHNLFSIENKDRIRTFVKEQIACDLGYECVAVLSHCTRRTEQTDNFESSEEKEDAVKSLCFMTMNALCGAHCYLLHSDDIMYRRSGQSSKFESNPFTTTLYEEEDDDKKEDESAATASQTIDWGKHVLEWFPFGVHPLFASFLEEIFKNPESKLTDKIMAWFHTECDVKIGEARSRGIIFTKEEILCLKIYSDTNELSAALRRAHWKRTALEIRKRFYQWAITMYRTFLFHAVPTPKLDISSFPMPLYHGLNQMFDVDVSRSPLYNGPFSTTTSNHVVQSFSKNNGLEFTVTPSYINPLKLILGIDMKSISSYPAEKEVLLYSQIIPITKAKAFGAASIDHLMFNLLKRKEPITNKTAFYQMLGIMFQNEWIDSILGHTNLLCESEYGRRLVAHRLQHELHVLDRRLSVNYDVHETTAYLVMRAEVRLGFNHPIRVHVFDSSPVLRNVVDIHCAEEIMIESKGVIDSQNENGKNEPLNAGDIILETSRRITNNGILRSNGSSGGVISLYAAEEIENNGKMECMNLNRDQSGGSVVIVSDDGFVNRGVVNCGVGGMVIIECNEFVNEGSITSGINVVVIGREKTMESSTEMQPSVSKGESVNLKVCQHRGHHGEYEPENLLKEGSGDFYISDQQHQPPSDDWIVFERNEELRFIPTAVIIRNNWNKSGIKRIAIDGGNNIDDLKEWIEIDGIHNEANREKQIFPIGSEQRYIAYIEQFKHFKLRILENHGNPNINSFIEFAILGVRLC